MFDKSRWLELNKYNTEHWIDKIGKVYYKILLTDDDKRDIINNIVSDNLKSELKKKSGGRWFVRLSTRSIKDAFYQMKIQPLTSVFDITERLLMSKRAYDDIKYSIKYNTDMYLFLIEWDDEMDIKNEFRCFMKDGQLQCISQYNIYDDLFFFEFEVPKIVIIIKNFMKTLDIKTGVIDVFIDREFNITLVEINPYDKTTSGIFYKWDEIGKSDFFRYKLYDEIRKWGIIL